MENLSDDHQKAGVGEKRLISRADKILSEGLLRAQSASLYENPADIFFTSTCLLLELLQQHEKAYSREIPLEQQVTLWDEHGQLLEKLTWTPEKSIETARAKNFTTATPQNTEHHHMSRHLVGTGLHIEISISTNTSPDHLRHAIPELAKKILLCWQTLIDQVGDKLWTITVRGGLNQGDKISPSDHKTQQLERVLVSRYREVLQRLEEELPFDLRAKSTKNGERIESSLLFIRRRISTPPAAGSDEDTSNTLLLKKKPGYLNYLLTREDLQTLDEWIAGGPGTLKEVLTQSASSISALVSQSETEENTAVTDICDAFIDYICAQERNATLCLLREAAEQPLYTSVDDALRKSFASEWAMDHGMPVISSCIEENPAATSSTPNSADLTSSLITFAIFQSNRTKHIIETCNHLFWPIKVLGFPLAVIQVPFNGSNPLFAKDEQEFDEFIHLQHALIRLSETAWHSIFDLYCEIFIDSFSNTYLEFTAESYREKHLRHSTKHQEQLIDALNHISDVLEHLTGIQVANWQQTTFPESNNNDVFTLWQLQEDQEAVEEDRDLSYRDDFESIRLTRLNNEKPLLTQLIFKNGDRTKANDTTQFMFEHLAWRLGHHIRYNLPNLLMTLDHGSAYSLKRYHDVLRHELGGFVSRSRELAAKVDPGPGNELNDLRRMLRLVQRTLGATDSNGIRNPISRPGRPTSIRDLFRFVERNFPAKFSITTQAGHTGNCEIVFSHTNELQAWIQEEDLYAIWQNLWTNSRQILDDVTRDTPSDTYRADKQYDIIENFRPYSMRFEGEDLPLPHLVAIFHVIQDGDSRKLAMDILDNAPWLKTGAVSYPNRIPVEHYGLSVVSEITQQLDAMGFPTQFHPPKELDQATASRYKKIETACPVSWNNLSNWSITSVHFSCE